MTQTVNVRKSYLLKQEVPILRMMIIPFRFKSENSQSKCES